jgi:hypothetical protein
MKRLKKAIVSLVAGISLFSCYYNDAGTGAEKMALLAGAAMDRPAARDGIPRLSAAERQLTLPQQRKKWTVLVYMDGDNNLSQFSTEDVKEMMGSGSDAGFNIVVLWDNDPSQDAAGAPVRHGYYYVEHDSVTLLKDAGEVNMGSPVTAKDFIAFAARNFPADHYLWIWWNHGGAVDRTSQKGVCWDDTSGGDHLTETEQKEIMLYLKQQTGKKIDIVGFDACLMATAEIAVQYAGPASYLVASEQTVPGNGWDYGFLSKIKSSPAITARTVAKHILAYFKNCYAGEDDVTLSVYYLAYAGQLAAALDVFAGAAMAGGGATAYRTLAKGLPMFGEYSNGSRECYYTKDLYAYLKKVKESPAVPESAKTKAEACMKIIADRTFVIAEWHGTAWKNAAYGVAVTLKHATAIYQKLDICSSTRWDEFLNWAKFPDNDYAY